MGAWTHVQRADHSAPPAPRAPAGLRHRRGGDRGASTLDHRVELLALEHASAEHDGVDPRRVPDVREWILREEYEVSALPWLGAAALAAYATARSSILARRRFDVGEIRLVVRPKRRGHTDRDHVRLLNPRKVT